jgi:hypothetical protein
MEMPVNELSVLIDDIIPMRLKKEHDLLLHNLQKIVSKHKYGKSRLAEISVSQVLGEEDFVALVTLYKSGHHIQFKNTWLNEKWEQLMQINFKDTGFSILGRLADFSGSAFEYTKEKAKEAYKYSQKLIMRSGYREDELDYDYVYDEIYIEVDDNQDFEGVYYVV